MFKKTACAVVLLMLSGTGYAMDYQDTDPDIFPSVPLPDIQVMDENGFSIDFDSDDPASEGKRSWAPKTHMKIKKRLSKKSEDRVAKDLFPDPLV